MQPLKILIVEDDRRIASGLHMLLLSEGNITVLLAEDHTQAREMFGQNSDIDIIFMDGNLPSGPTLNLIREFRAAGFGGDLIAVIGTGVGFGRQMIEAGCNRLFHKPFGSKEFRQIIRDKRGQTLVQPN